MGVKTGYKQTEVGVIPEDWEINKFGNFVSIRNIKVMPSNIEPNTLCVELEHIEQSNGKLIIRSIASSSTSIKYSFKREDVLFGRLRAYLHKYWLADTDGICTTEIWPLIADSNKATSGYLHAIVQTQRFIEAASISYGTHMPRSDWDVIRELNVALPPLPEQTAIATALSDADALIQSLGRLIAKKRDIKQGAMQELLTGKKRLQGFEKKKGYQQTEVGAIPEDWGVKCLGELSFIKTGSRNNENKVEDGIYPFYVRSPNVEKINTYAYDGEAILVPGEGNIGNILGPVTIWGTNFLSEKCSNTGDAISRLSGLLALRDYVPNSP